MRCPKCQVLQFRQRRPAAATVATISRFAIEVARRSRSADSERQRTARAVHGVDASRASTAAPAASHASDDFAAGAQTPASMRRSAASGSIFRRLRDRAARAKSGAVVTPSGRPRAPLSVRRARPWSPKAAAATSRGRIDGGATPEPRLALDTDTGRTCRQPLAWAPRRAQARQAPRSAPIAARLVGGAIDFAIMSRHRPRRGLLHA